LARTRDNNWKHVIFIVLLYAVTAMLLFWFLGWNKVDTPFAFEFLQRLGIAGVENLSDEAVREVWFQVMAGVYGTTVGISAAMAAIWNAVFWKAGKPSRRGLENCLFALFLVLHVLMTFLVSLLSGVFGFVTSMTLDGYDLLAYNGMFLFNIPFALSQWLFSPVGMRSSLFKKW
jgi:hypothetical protein